jgi:anthranilate phosphoribosyltransferase
MGTENAMDIKTALARLVQRQDLSRAEMTAVMHQIMGGDATDAQIGAFLVALRMKGETIDEIAAAAGVMRELATAVRPARDKLVDLVGTGGDDANLFNVSTAATFVAAAAGVALAKHGNRSVSSTSGSSDVLETLGVPLDLDPTQVARAIDEVGVGFMFAPLHHSAMRHAVGPRRELALRTLFNILGQLTNPAGVRRQVLGVFAAELCRPLAEVLKVLGSEHVMVVHARDGLYEISIAAETDVAELRDGSVTEYSIKPEDFGIERMDLEGLDVNSAGQSAALIRAVFDRRDDPVTRKAAALIALNAGAAIYVGGAAPTLADAVRLADDLIASGQAGEKLAHFVDFTQLMKGAAG